MKKYMISRFLLSAVLVAMMAACSNKSSDNTYVNVIPEDAQLILGVNLQSLLNKSGVDDADKQKLLDAMKNEMSEAMFKNVEAIIKDPAASGLSAKDPFYVYGNTGDHKQKGSVLFKVGDLPKLKALMKSLVDEKIVESVTEEDGVNVVRIEGTVAAAFNESALLISSDVDNTVDQLKKGAAKDAKPNANVDLLLKNKGTDDLAVYFSFAAIPEEYLRQNPAYQQMEGFSFSVKDYAVAGWVNFENGKISLKAETLCLTEEAKKNIEMGKDVYGKLEKTFVDFFPKTMPLFAAFNIKGDALMTYLDKFNLLKDIPAEEAGMVKALISSLNGEVSMGLADVNMQGAKFGVYAQAKSGEALDAILAKSGMNKEGDGYVFSQGNMSIYMGYKDGYLYVSDTKAGEAKPAESFAKSEYAKDMDGKLNYFVWDIQSTINMPIVQMLKGFGSKEAAMAFDIASKFACLEVYSTDTTKSEINIVMVDKDTNALKQIVDLARAYVK